MGKRSHHDEPRGNGGKNRANAAARDVAHGLRRKAEFGRTDCERKSGKKSRKEELHDRKAELNDRKGERQTVNEGARRKD
jgi:hypothetical protein